MEQPIVIDLDQKNKLNESWLMMFGAATQSILRAMFGGYSVPVSITGNRNQIEAYAKTLGKEKSFLDSARKFGLTNPSTYRNKFELNRAIREFERTTGITWPLK